MRPALLEPSLRAGECVGTKRVVVECDVQTGLLVASSTARPAHRGFPRPLGLSFEADLMSSCSGRVAAVARKRESKQTGPRAEDIGRLEAESKGVCLGGVVASVDSQVKHDPAPRWSLCL